jgi:hypothetical protein
MRIASSIIGLLVVLATAGIVHAQPAADPSDGKSPALATVLSVGSTVVAGGILWLSVVNDQRLGVYASLPLLAVGPSAGHIYAGELKHALGMSLLRGGLLAVAGYGAGMIGPYGKDVPPEAHDDDGTGMLLFLGGSITYLAASVYDFIHAHRAAERSGNVLVAATVLGTTGATLGLSLGGSF